MYKLSALFLLQLYIGLLMHPFMPFLEFSAKQQYIAETLCENKSKPELNCNGKCYLKKQVKKAHSEHSQQQNRAPRAQRDINILAVLDIIKGQKPHVKENHKISSFYSFFLNECYLEIPTPPPKVII